MFRDHAITVDDQLALSGVSFSEYQLNDKSSNPDGHDASPEFVKDALQYVHEIPGYSDHVWDINASSIKGCTMFAKRYVPSMCVACNRRRDNDNTLFLIFDSDLGVAFWKCTRNPDMRARKFYQRFSGQKRDG